MERQHLWVVEWRPGHDNLVPSAKFFPDWEDYNIEVIVADQFYAVVRDDLDHLQSALRDFPYQHVGGHPADGRWVGEGGDEVFICDGRVVSLAELCDGLGFDIANFATEPGQDWDDIDEAILYDQIPSF